MRGWDTLMRLCLAGLISLVLAAPALGAPADKEYVLKIPSIAGEVVVAEGTEGAGSTILAPEVRGRDAAAGSGADGGSGSGSEGNGAGSPVAQVSGDDSSAARDTLLDPVVLLLIASVAAAAIGLTLRHRRSG
jgi:hypothetical protein